MVALSSRLFFGLKNCTASIFLLSRDTRRCSKVPHNHQHLFHKLLRTKEEDALACDRKLGFVTGLCLENAFLLISSRRRRQKPASRLLQCCDGARLNLQVPSQLVQVPSKLAHPTASWSSRLAETIGLALSAPLLF